ncbi:MAG TPA: sulfotransferase [Vicinamibacterales bacterium]|nr:sulfotransferase [Vicinamibacterales bacterium]
MRTGNVTQLAVKTAIAPDVRLALIASGCHSGSTMLDMMLGSHTAISGSGEMNRLTLYSDDRACTCGTPIAVCPYWTQVLGRLALAAGRETLRWSECHTDVPPFQPILELDETSDLTLVEGEPVPARLASALQHLGVALSPKATLTHGGVRDVKWRVLDEGGRELVIRREQGRLQVYPPLFQWKNHLRKLPSTLELALGVGAERSVEWLAKVSREAHTHLNAARNTWLVAEAMAASDRTQVVVDSSKSAIRLKLLYITRPQSVRVIHLVRDGRAVAASDIRRRGRAPAIAAKVWKRENQHLRLVLGGIPAAQKHKVRYEDVCENPERELRLICDFLSLDFEPGMLQLWDRAVHNVPGNPFLFKNRQHSIAKDDRWRRELSHDQLATIERIVGPLNRALGYSS